MRRLNEKEKQFCKVIRRLNVLTDNFIEQICAVEFGEERVVVDVIQEWIRVISPPSVRLKMVVSEKNGQPNFTVTNDKRVIETLVTCVKLVELLEKEGLIYLYNNRQLAYQYYLGSVIQGSCTEFHLNVDKDIFRSILSLITKGIVTTADFEEFIDNDFRTQKEINETNQLKIALSGTYISAISAIIAAFAVLVQIIVSIFGK